MKLARSPYHAGEPLLPGLTTHAFGCALPSMHQTVPRHAPVCDTSTRVVGVVWSGRVAIRYGPQPHHPGEPRPGACPTPNGLPASPHMHPAVGFHQTVPRHVSPCDTSTRWLALCVAAGWPNGTARNPTAQGSPTLVPHPEWAPGLTTHAPGCGLPPNRAQTCICM